MLLEAGGKAAEDRKVRLLEEMQAQGSGKGQKGKGNAVGTAAKGVQREQGDQRNRRTEERREGGTGRN
jgi:hypothetical protein